MQADQGERIQKTVGVGAPARTSPATFIVNFHGIGTIARPYDPGEAPFWLTHREFRAALDAVQATPCERKVSLTFDDGNVSDYAIAAPELLRRKVTAAFFIVAGRLGKRAFLSKAQLRDLVDAGFEIGSHGLDHVDWTRLRDRDLAREVADSKAMLEDEIGTAIRRAAIPFGRYNRKVLRALRKAGYAEVLSSDGGPRLSRNWPVPRRSLREGATTASVSTLIQRGHVLTKRAACEGRLLVKALSL